MMNEGDFDSLCPYVIGNAKQDGELNGNGLVFRMGHFLIMQLLSGNYVMPISSSSGFSRDALLIAQQDLYIHLHPYFFFFRL